ncbi:ATP-binding protein [Shewanella sp. C32]|uniref:histidine kinase n=1 Tax=Shewanella electrica TaxID=515560 RepID=A0ABT2FGR1_9GAMM|nr:ATP-binding protein [Shewanella electrica]MCH1923392.1 ATP-binding protein [Shewanella electrica]MCS4555489.1 ATP-binding protein [Shewanella electrica]
MHKQFLRVYLLLIVSVIGLLVGFGKLFETLVAPQDSYQVAVRELFDQASLTSQPSLVTTLPREAVQFPQAIAEQLRQGNTVAVKLADERLTYYRLDGEILLALGPLHDDSSLWAETEHHFTAIFYTALALLLLLLLYPIARDLLRVQRAAMLFAEQPQRLTIDVKPTSSVYPLAHTLETMSVRHMESEALQKDLANIVAHEVRTPLARMEFVLQSIESHIDGKYALRLQKDIDEINSLVEDYLAFAREQYQQPEINLQRLPASTLAAQLKDKFAVYQSRINISFDVDEQSCVYDLQLLQVAVQNLLTNALRYAKQRIHLRWSINDYECRIMVSDDGVGLKDKHQALKQAFARGDTGGDTMGFGLGLYICHQIAVRHSGQLEISRCEHLGGASFEIRWPNKLPLPTV